jgi:hypothetical protein
VTCRGVDSPTLGHSSLSEALDRAVGVNDAEENAVGRVAGVERRTHGDDERLIVSTRQSRRSLELVRIGERIGVYQREMRRDLTCPVGVPFAS